MDVNVLFAGIPVDDFEAARSWYERFFARPPDVVAHENEVLWRCADAGWVYVVRDPDHAGNSIIAMAVSDLREAISALAARGVTAGPIEPDGDGARKAVVLDPDGNSISIIEVTAAA